MGRSPRRRVVAPPADPARDLRHDRIRGLLLGAIAGEALGARACGLSRDEILRRFGRIVEVSAGGGRGGLAAALAPFFDRLRAGDRPDSPACSGLVAAEPEIALALAICASALAPRAQAQARVELADAGSEPAGDALRRAASILGVAAAHAASTSPYRRLPAASILAEILAEVACSPAARPDPSLSPLLAAVERLRAHVLSPPAPREAASAFAALPPPLPLALLALHSLLVRPRSLEEAVVYTVNLGGEAASRGAIVGMIAGVHRGAAAIPRRWLAAIPDIQAAVRRIETAAVALDRTGERDDAGRGSL